MTTERQDNQERDDLERLASSLRGLDPPDTVWQRIESDLRALRQREAEKRERSFPEQIGRLFRRPALRFAVYALLLLGGSGMGWYLLQDYGKRHELFSFSEADSSGDILQDAREDIEQAMFYYERAIEKLSIAAQERESELDPEFVALQKEKIRLLRESIDECKTTLRDNGLHPRVQHYLLAAYSDLQSTLQEMLSQQQ
jgi:hypothetical protein